MGPLGVRSQAGLLETVPHILPPDLPLLASPDPTGRPLFAQIIQGPFLSPVTQKPWQDAFLLTGLRLGT